MLYTFDLGYTTLVFEYNTFNTEYMLVYTHI